MAHDPVNYDIIEQITALRFRCSFKGRRNDGSKGSSFTLPPGIEENQRYTQSADRMKKRETGLFEFMILIVFFASGFAALVYQVLWMKELTLVFGSAAQSAAITLAAFFLGLASGSHVFANVSKSSQTPLKTYAWLEAAIVVSAALYFLLIDIFSAVYPPIFQYLGAESSWLLLAKMGLAILLLGPAAFFIGGTLPIMAQIFVRTRRELGFKAPLLYAINILGGAAGSFVAAFHLPPLMGFDRAYVLAMSISAALAAIMFFLDWRSKSPPLGEILSAPEIWPEIPDKRRTTLSYPLIVLLAALSGFATLAVEILWIRMFAQVLQNSVYTYGLILSTILLALGIGGFLAASLARQRWNPVTVLSGILMFSGFGISASAAAFVVATDGLSYFGGDASWILYILGILTLAAFTILPAGVIIGTVFPYLIRIASPLSRGAGLTVGRLAAVNTIAGIIGSLTAGFIMLELFGLWSSLWLVAASYLLCGLVLSSFCLRRLTWITVLPCAASLLIMYVAATGSIFGNDFVGDDTAKGVLQAWDGPSARVAVIRENGEIKIQINSHYTLGSSAVRNSERWQAHLPLLLHPNPRKVFFLGMGTGITAGASLNHPVSRVVVSELVPRVIDAARAHFKPYLNGLFEDRRVEIRGMDGRNLLWAGEEKFDLIIADLFIPWRVGVGNLYSRQHYQTAQQNLSPDGLFVQWLPLYQVGRREFNIITKTMAETFPLVTLWRGDFSVEQPIVALIGHNNASPLRPDSVSRRVEEFRRAGGGIFPFSEFEQDASPAFNLHRYGDAEAMLLYYAGNLSMIPELYDDAPINSDTKPVLEYTSPKAQRATSAGTSDMLTGARLISLLDQIIAGRLPPSKDPYLALFGNHAIGHAEAGFALYLSVVLDQAGEQQRALMARQFFEKHIGSRDVKTE